MIKGDIDLTEKLDFYHDKPEKKSNHYSLIPWSQKPVKKKDEIEAEKINAIFDPALNEMINYSTYSTLTNTTGWSNIDYMNTGYINYANITANSSVSNYITITSHIDNFDYDLGMTEYNNIPYEVYSDYNSNTSTELSNNYSVSYYVNNRIINVDYQAPMITWNDFEREYDYFTPPKRGLFGRWNDKLPLKIQKLKDIFGKSIRSKEECYSIAERCYKCNCITIGKCRCERKEYSSSKVMRLFERSDDRKIYKAEDKEDDYKYAYKLLKKTKKSRPKLGDDYDDYDEALWYRYHYDKKFTLKDIPWLKKLNSRMLSDYIEDLYEEQDYSEYLTNMSWIGIH